MGPADLLTLATIVLTGALMAICWVFAEEKRRR